MVHIKPRDTIDAEPVRAPSEDKNRSLRRSTVLHVTECPSGGVSRAIELAIKATPALSHVVLAPAGTVRTHDLGADFVSLPETHRGRLRAVSRAIKTSRASAVHAHSSWGGLYARIVASRTPILYQPHCFAFSDVTKPRFLRGAYWLAERIMARRAAAVLALTPYEERQAHRLGVRTVHGIVNAPTLPRAPALIEARSARRRPEQRTVAMVGRVSAQKDPQFFAAVASYFSAVGNVKFLWIGGDSDESARYEEGHDAPVQRGRRSHRMDRRERVGSATCGSRHIPSLRIV
ncbi:hypothetical protein Xcel_2905 [Xylanimonas cellulosilytica DSM 15894]|uniref:Glycosyltransferase subfamily 4-like N-terminal domain-containing protein n=1 Tax=Xylanimonas cellulosilytica (strain DSM 15894 / JCM 12276 / CECT 5975 / KCTC 9989 / LMG 20990 / NBRC 107835 / XIL07) TaxID=446471 RepID=D1BZ16_XYLCX|nr:hypothetical protein Xcel_2905 [Xylanimonas cellulosilytica DSM 15894]